MNVIFYHSLRPVMHVARYSTIQPLLLTGIYGECTVMFVGSVFMPVGYFVLSNET